MNKGLNGVKGDLRLWRTIFAVLIALAVFILCCGCGGKSQAKEERIATLTYEEVTENGETVGYCVTGMKDGTVLQIPDEYGGKPVLEIAARAFFREGIVRAKMGANVRKIGDYAFYGCNALESVDLGAGVREIGFFCFSGCGEMIQISFGSRLTRIKENAFSDCRSLRRVEVSDLSAWCNVTFQSPGANPLFYSHHLYCEGSLVTQLNLSAVQSVGDYAFGWCDDLVSVTLGERVDSVGESAFHGCSGLTSVTVGSGVKTIGDEAFFQCYRLLEVINLSQLNIRAGSSSYGCVGYYAKQIQEI